MRCCVSYRHHSWGGVMLMVDQMHGGGLRVAVLVLVLVLAVGVMLLLRRLLVMPRQQVPPLMHQQMLLCPREALLVMLVHLMLMHMMHLLHLLLLLPSAIVSFK